MKITRYALHILIVIAIFGIFNFNGVAKASPNGGVCEGNEESPNPSDCALGGGHWKPDSVALVPACSTLTGVGKIICQVNQILGSIVPVIVSLGLIYFIWGVVQYVIAGGDEAKKKGKDQMIYGLIGLTVIVSVWGLVNIVTRTFDLGGTAPSLVPLTGSGTGCSLANNPKLQDLLCYVTGIINNSVVPLIFSLALVMFIWGVVQFVINSSEEVKKEKGRQFMIWGIIALTVMVCVWGLVGILGGTFGFNTTLIPQVKPSTP